MRTSKVAVFLAWERLRIVYNLILLSEVLWVLREHLAGAFAGSSGVMSLFAIIANACFFLGPLVEICVRSLLGSRGERPRYQLSMLALRCLLFWAGLGYSMRFVWGVSLGGLRRLGGIPAHYAFRRGDEYELAFLSLLAWVSVLYWALAILFLIIKAREKRV